MNATNKNPSPQMDGMRQYAKQYQEKALDEAQQYRADAFDATEVDDYQNIKQSSTPIRIFKWIFWTILIVGLLLAAYLIPLSIYGAF